MLLIGPYTPTATQNAGQCRQQQKDLGLWGFFKVLRKAAEAGFELLDYGYDCEAPAPEKDSRNDILLLANETCSQASTVPEKQRVK